MTQILRKNSKKAVYYLIENKEILFPEENEISYFNPAEVTLTGTPTWQDYMKYDLKILIECNAIFMLKD